VSRYATTRSRRTSPAATSTSAGRTPGVLGRDLAAGAGPYGQLRVPSRSGLHQDHHRARGHLAEILYFVPPAPPDDPCPAELWVLRLANRSLTSQVIQVFSYVELSFADASSDMHNLDWSQHVLSSRYDEARHAIVTGTRFSPTTQFFASDRAPLGYDCDREAFVGPYPGLESPAVVVAGSRTGARLPAETTCGSLFHEVSLEPGAEARIVYVLGITDTPDPSARSLGDTVTQPRWGSPSRLSALTGRPTSGPSACRPRMLTPLPCSTVGTHCNAAPPCTGHVFVSGTRPALGEDRHPRHSPGHLGSGTRCPGRSRIPHGAAVGVQFEDGHCWHQFFPLTGKGGPGLAAERPACPSGSATTTSGWS